MGKAGTKNIVLLGVWLAMLAGVIAFVNMMGGTVEPIKPLPHPIPKLDSGKLASQWPQIVAHAAAPPRGQTDASYTIAEFGDFQCPQCGKVRPLLEKLLQQYPTQVNLIFIHRPFPSIHKWALAASQASEIAAAQGKFWPMYDILYAHQDDLETGFYTDYAAQAGLNKAQFKTAFNAGQGQNKVTAAAQFADSIGIQETPWLLVRDNAAKTLTMYVGMDTQKNAEGGIPYNGINDLMQKPPWVK